MADEKKSIFDLIDKFGGYDGPFDSDWDRVDFQNRTFEGVKIIDMKAFPNYQKENSILFGTPSLPLARTNVVSNNDSVTVYVTITALVDIRPDYVKFSLNNGTKINGYKSLSNTFQYEANFKVIVGKSLARRDQYNSQEFTFTAESFDATLNKVTDTRSIKVLIDTNGVIVNNSIIENESNVECICKKTNWSSEDLNYIVTQLRKKDVLKVGGKIIKNEKNEIIAKEDFTLYDDKSSDGQQIKDRLFYMKRDEKLEESSVNYPNFSKILNAVFKEFEINTCLRKIHFLTQIYQETSRFRATYENVSGTGYTGGSFYQGRGFMQLTHDYNYIAFYSYLFDKEPSEEELKEFVPKVAKNFEYALKSAGWFWKNKNINKYADLDDVERVSAAINYPALLSQSVFNPDKINGLDSRKKFYLILKEILNYDRCKN